MLKLTAQQEKTIKKYKQNVVKRYPGAYLARISNGYYTIMQEQDDLIAVDVLSNLLHAPQKDPVQAWYLAHTSCKVSQNIDRTHPMRLEGMNLSDKIKRVQNRRIRSEGSQNSKHLLYDDIY